MLAGKDDQSIAIDRGLFKAQLNNHDGAFSENS